MFKQTAPKCQPNPRADNGDGLDNAIKTRSRHPSQMSPMWNSHKTRRRYEGRSSIQAKVRAQIRKCSRSGQLRSADQRTVRANCHLIHEHLQEGCKPEGAGYVNHFARSYFGAILCRFGVQRSRLARKPIWQRQLKPKESHVNVSFVGGIMRMRVVRVVELWLSMCMRMRIRMRMGMTVNMLMTMARHM